jgi:hypothetical protein
VEDPINDTSSSKRINNKQEQLLRQQEMLRQNQVYTAYKRTQHGQVG